MTIALEYDLDDLIRQYVNLGEKDPLDIARRIENDHADTLGDLLVPFAEEIIRERARNALGYQRRARERALGDDDGGPSAQAEIKTAKVWIPETGWMRLGDCKPEDLEARAVYYEKMGHLALARATWCREVAMMMREEGAKTLGKLKNVPPIPGAVI